MTAPAPEALRAALDPPYSSSDVDLVERFLRATDGRASSVFGYRAFVRSICRSLHRLLIDGLERPRLLSELADLTAQLAIAREEREAIAHAAGHSTLMSWPVTTTISRTRAECDALKGEIARKDAALRPFAMRASECEARYTAPLPDEYGELVALGALRDARAALAQEARDDG